MLTHEDQLEEKDAEISSLRSQITLVQLLLRHSPEARVPTESVGSASRDDLPTARF